MDTHEALQHCAVFLYCQKSTGGLRPCGTAFLVNSAHGVRGKPATTYVVTAKHNLEGIILQNKKNSDVQLRTWIRVNPKVYATSKAKNKKRNAAIDIEIPWNAWKKHPKNDLVDVVAAEFIHRRRAAMDYTIIDTEECATWEHIRSHRVGIGNPIFVPGLFHKHTGGNRIQPIVRTGTVAMRPTEPVDGSGKYKDIEGILVEMKSIVGLSGSPVFVQHTGISAEFESYITGTRPPVYLLGLIHGHWDVNIPSDYDTVDGNNMEKVNIGVAIVVPAPKIIEVLESGLFMNGQETKAKGKQKAKAKRK